MNSEIKLIALDMDGTLFNQKSVISTENRTALKKAVSAGIHVVIATGRPYIGLPLDDMADIGIHYAITSNGAGVYEVPEKNCIYEQTIPPELGSVLLKKLYRYQIHLDAFIGGGAYTQTSTRKYIPNLLMPDPLRAYVRDTRIVVDDLAKKVLEERLGIQKLTLNFMPDDNGNLIDREKICAMLSEYPNLHYVSGGYSNIEVNLSGLSKAKGLEVICQKLGLTSANILACGDSENDLAMIQYAGIGVAMANGESIVKESADYITGSNQEDGVAHAVYKFCAV